MAKRQLEEAEVEKMLRQGVISPSSSPWASPTVLITKKDGKTRFCVDYRELNQVTVKDAYPLPRVEDCIDNLEGAQWFCTMDVQSGFWQVELDPKDKEKTSFCTRLGLYQFNVLPFGLTNAPATFERLMETVLRGLQWYECLLFFDDIVVFGLAFEITLARLEHVFQRLMDAGLKLKPKKCVLFQKEVEFLGHIVGADGVKTQPDKIECVRNWPTPKNRKEVRSFLGLAGYYRRFIKDFAGMARPLTALTSVEASFQWNTECDKSFMDLKEALTTAPVLGYPKPEGQMILDTDASGFAVGAVLSQIQDGREVVLAYLSKALSAAEQNYCITRKELFAVVTASKAWHPYLYGRSVMVRTDNTAVAWAKWLKRPVGQMARWLQVLGTYDLHEVHRPGHIHWNADALSRRPQTPCSQCSREEGPCNDYGPPNKDVAFCAALTRAQAKQDQTGPNQDLNVSESPNVLSTDQGWSSAEVREEQLRDPDISTVMRALASGQKRPEWQVIAAESESAKALWAQFNRLKFINGVLHRSWENDTGTATKWRLVVPRTQRNFVLSQAHDAPLGGHLGSDKTMSKIQDSFYWVNMRRDVRQYCQACDQCAARKPVLHHRRAPMKSFVVGSPMERVTTDIMGPLDRTVSGNKYILVVTDVFTKWTEAYTLRNIESKTVARKFVEEWVCRYGAPRVLHSDQGRQFESSLFKEMCKLLGIKKTHTTALRPQANGQVERFNRTLGALLAIYTQEDPSKWDRHLPFITPLIVQQSTTLQVRPQTL